MALLLIISTEPLIANVLFFILKIMYLITLQLMGNEVNNPNSLSVCMCARLCVPSGVLERLVLYCIYQRICDGIKLTTSFQHCARVLMLRAHYVTKPQKTCDSSDLLKCSSI